MFLILLAAATPVVTQRPERCTHPGTERVATREPMRARRLGEMPPAKQLLSVYRSVDGCPEPVVVRAEVGQPRR